MDFKYLHEDFIDTIKKLNIYSQKGEKTKVILNKNEIFNDDFSLIAGPCSIENYEQLDEIASIIKKNGDRYLRAGTFKLRTSPDSYQGLGEEALKILYEVGKKYNLITVSELPSLKQLDLFKKYVDVIVVGMRNMRNFEMLKELGKLQKPIMLKRGDSATVLEWIYAAQYIYNGGNKNIILCERGIKTFETSTRNTLDIAGALLAQKYTIFKVILDPSHGVGLSYLVPKFTLMSKHIGLDGSIIEVTTDPKNAKSDGYQSLDLIEYKNLKKEL